MGTNGFREDELVSRRVKVGNEWQTRVFPIIGGRLRILHENNDHLSIQTEIVRLDSDFVVVRAAVESQRGKFNGTGTASGQRDARLADSLVELAETRAIAQGASIRRDRSWSTQVPRKSLMWPPQSLKESKARAKSQNECYLRAMARANLRRNRLVMAMEEPPKLSAAHSGR